MEHEHITDEVMTDEMIEQQRLRKERFKKEAKEWIFTLAIFFTVFLVVIRPFVFEMYSVRGASMQPTFMGNERVFGNKFVYRVLGHKPKRGEVVMVDPVDAKNTNEDMKKDFWIKRIVAEEGDRVAIKNGQLYLNGEEMQEEYVKFHKAENMPELTVPEGYVFFAGDNRANSHDGRTTGPVPADSIKARAEFKWWPISQWGVVR